ncbi:MAG: sugar ABC transporter permease, partial [Leifsonia sp.]
MTTMNTRLAVPRRRRSFAPYALLIPSVVVLVLALGYPLIWQLVTSLQQFGLSQQFGQPAPFVGLDNYIRLATDPYLWTVVGRSLMFCFAVAAATMAIGTLLALLMRAVPHAVRI